MKKRKFIIPNINYLQKCKLNLQKILIYLTTILELFLIPLSFFAIRNILYENKVATIYISKKTCEHSKIKYYQPYYKNKIITYFKNNNKFSHSTPSIHCWKYKCNSKISQNITGKLLTSYIIKSIFVFIIGYFIIYCTYKVFNNTK